MSLVIKKVQTKITISDSPGDKNLEVWHRNGVDPCELSYIAGMSINFQNWHNYLRE
jgi:hypothetical protein